MPPKKAHRTSSKKPVKRQTDWSALMLPVILLIGLGLRVYHLGAESIWQDEAWAVYDAKMGFVQMIEHLISYDFNPPLHFLLLHVWIKVFGTSEFAVRLLSALLGTLGVYAIYLLAQKLFDRETGMLSALIFALAAYQVYYAQEARGYSLMALLAILSFYFFLRLFEGRNPAVTAGYIVSTTFLLYTHMYGAFVLVAQDLYLLAPTALPRLRKGGPAAESRSLRAWLPSQLAVIALFSPWLLILPDYIEGAKELTGQLVGTLWMDTPSFADMAAALSDFAWSPWMLLILVGLPLALFLAGGSKGFQAFGRSSDGLKQGRRPASSSGNEIVLLVVWLLVPLVLVFAVSVLFVPVFDAKYAIAASPALYILAAWLIGRLKPRVKLVLVVLVVAGSLAGLWNYYTTVWKGPWRSIVEYVDANARPGDVLYFNPGESRSILFDYYSKRPDLVKKAFSDLDSPVRIGSRNAPQLVNVMAEDRFWVISLKSLDQEDILDSTLKRTHTRVFEGSSLSMTVRVYEKNGEDSEKAPSRQ
ncbi:MAG: glycosyltransferase family 39 protein [Candidatus Aquicultorales bacterium]